VSLPGPALVEGAQADAGQSAQPSLDRARAAYGRGTWVFAEHTLVLERTWWLALSGTASPDYNQALLYGEDADEIAPQVLALIDELAQPCVVFLAGPGLAAAQQLGDRGWVCVGALPFMYRPARQATPDPRVASLSLADLSAARTLLMTSFDVAPDACALLFQPRLLEREDARAWGLFDPELASVAITAEVGDGLYVGWALATLPSQQRRGLGSSLLRHIDHFYMAHGRLGSLHLASSAGARLYAARAHTTLEHWQAWSKPRWVLGR
jgi:GNAT superfamily N-acetyltransferase